MGRKEKIKEEMLIKWIYILSIVLSISILIFLFIFYLSKDSKINSSYDAEIAYVESIETTSSNDKNKNEIIGELINNNVLTLNKVKEVSKMENKVENNVISKKEEKIENKVEVNEITAGNIEVENIVDEVKKEKENESNIDISKEEFKIVAPIQGEIIKDYAKDTLLYSQTLDEWCVHLGIDIKAAKTSVVVASADGIVEKITKDPRYGNSITIDHQNGFKTVYSSLLVTDFVNIGEKVLKGDSIGTVGETAVIEMLDDCHLHFELYKDGQSVNPTLYF